jgi:3-oxoacyl-[acyl-carrier protein] reductase
VPPLDRPVALVTGASRGLGRVIATAFAREGYAVAVHYNTHLEEAKETAKLVEGAGAPAFIVKADVRKSAPVNAMIKSIDKHFGRLDVLVNNAGLVRNRAIARMTDKEWSDVVAGNLDGTFYCTRAALPLLRKKRDGVVLCISSFSALRGARGAGNYAAAKAGVIAFTKSLALEESPNGIRANAILPGFHVTDINRDYWEKFEAKIREQHLLGGRMPDREELGRFVVGIAKLQSVTGQVFPFESRIL